MERRIHVKGFVLAGFLSLGATLAIGPIDAQILSLYDAGRYGEAWNLIQARLPETAEWAAHHTNLSLPPLQLNRTQSYPQAVKLACSYRQANPEAYAYCLYGLAFPTPQVADWVKAGELPSLSQEQIRTELESLAGKGDSLTTYATYFLGRVEFAGLLGYKPNPEKAVKRLGDLVRASPDTLGGRLAMGLLSQVYYWGIGGVQANPSLGALYARKAGATSAFAAGMLTYLEYRGSGGVERNPSAACNRANFWAIRTPDSPSLYVLGLCYWEGAGGFPKDPIEAYGLIWSSAQVGGGNIPEITKALDVLEKSLTPEQKKEGRERAQTKYFP
jgi:TPR repeat protein